MQQPELIAISRTSQSKLAFSCGVTVGNPISKNESTKSLALNTRAVVGTAMIHAYERDKVTEINGGHSMKLQVELKGLGVLGRGTSSIFETFKGRL